MKIFNWVNLRLHPCSNYCPVSQTKEVLLEGDEGEKCRPPAREKELEKDTEALLLCDVLTGILTIGTFGHPPYSVQEKLFADAAERDQEKEEEEGNEEEGSGAAALVVQKRSPPLAFVPWKPLDRPSSTETEKTERSAAVLVTEAEDVEAKKLLEKPLLLTKVDDDENKERGRTTLADLFAAEPSVLTTNPDKRVAVPAAQQLGKGRKSLKQKTKGKGAAPRPASAATKMLQRVQCLLPPSLSLKRREIFLHIQNVAASAVFSPPLCFSREERNHLSQDLIAGRNPNEEDDTSTGGGVLGYVLSCKK